MLLAMRKCKVGVEKMRIESIRKTKHSYFTFKFENSSCEAILVASFLFCPVTKAFSHTSFPITLASTEKVFACFDVRSCNSKLWHWQSSCKSLIGLSCKLDENFMIGSKNEVIISQTLFKSNPESRRTAPTQDSTKSPRAWNNPQCQFWPHNFYANYKAIQIHHTLLSF